MEKDNTTPEEKLLKIIENPELSEKRKVPGKEEISGKLNELISRYKNLHFDINALKNVEVRTINKIVAVICAVITLFVIYDVVHNNIIFGRKFQNITAEPAGTAAERAKAINIDVKVKDVLSQARNRNIFTLLPPKPTTIERVDIGGPVELKLVGVLWSDNPQAMIENIKEQKTYFVGVGDKIGVVTVKAIMQNKVILSKDTEEWELR